MLVSISDPANDPTCRAANDRQGAIVARSASGRDLAISAGHQERERSVLAAELKLARAAGAHQTDVLDFNSIANG
jgi:hypothetical protein